VGAQKLSMGHENPKMKQKRKKNKKIKENKKNE
jgi:hypothetical protein